MTTLAQPAAPSAARASDERFVFEAMGTVISITAAGIPAELQDAIREAFERLEERFSLYRPHTEAARVARRELLVRHTTPEYRSVYDAAIDWRTRTDGAFTPHRPDGAIDLSGIVKALAIAETAELLDAAGLTGWCVNAGGDVAVSGTQADGRPWVVGIVDPDDRTALLSQYEASGRRAVATSGIAERGEHVWRAAADATFTQVTVVADDIVTADVLATAILAGGPAMLERAQARWQIEVLACAADGRCWATPAFRA